MKCLIIINNPLWLLKSRTDPTPSLMPQDSPSGLECHPPPASSLPGEPFRAPGSFSAQLSLPSPGRCSHSVSLCFHGNSHTLGIALLILNYMCTCDFHSVSTLNSRAGFRSELILLFLWKSSWYSVVLPQCVVMRKSSTNMHSHMMLFIAPVHGSLCPRHLSTSLPSTCRTLFIL